MGKRRKPKKCELLTRLQVWATEALSHWRTLGDSTEHTLGWSNYPLTIKKKEAGVFILNSNSSLAESCSQGR